MKKNVTKRIFGGLMFVAVFAALIAVVMLLWNALIPGIIGWTAIGYWQAAGLMILSRILLGGFGHHWKGGFGRHCGRHGRHGRHGEFHDRLKGMSRDERRKFIKERMRGHMFGGDFDYEDHKHECGNKDHRDESDTPQSDKN